jgi:hypothetical protein
MSQNTLPAAVQAERARCVTIVSMCNGDHQVAAMAIHRGWSRDEFLTQLPKLRAKGTGPAAAGAKIDDATVREVYARRAASMADAQDS